MFLDKRGALQMSGAHITNHQIRLFMQSKQDGKSIENCCCATILEVIMENDKKWQIILDQTIFYPRGGGQSTDQGTIFTKNQNLS